MFGYGQQADQPKLSYAMVHPHLPRRKVGGSTSNGLKTVKLYTGVLAAELAVKSFHPRRNARVKSFGYSSKRIQSVNDS